MMREQKGFVFKASGGWYVKYRESVLEKGKPVRKLVTHRLADVDDYCKNKSDAIKKAKEFLAPFNDGKVTPASAMTLDEFVNAKYGAAGSTIGYWEYAEQSVRPATLYGYKRTYADYLKEPFGSKALRHIKRVDVVGYLLNMNKKKGRRVTRSAKAVGSAIFSYALTLGIVENNPFLGKFLPKQPKKEHEAVSTELVAAQLAAVQSEPQAKVAIGLGFFGGMRPAEIRGCKWEDYDPKTRLLLIQRSMWRTKENGTKTEDAEGKVCITDTLAQYLEELRKHDGNPRTGFILRNEDGGSMSLENLTRRTILPRLRALNIPWYGFYSLRRGAGTTMTNVAGDRGLAAKGLLRHRDLATTTQFYVKDVPAETLLAAQKVDTLFQTTFQKTLAEQSECSITVPKSDAASDVTATK